MIDETYPPNCDNRTWCKQKSNSPKKRGGMNFADSQHRRLRAVSKDYPTCRPDIDRWQKNHATLQIYHSSTSASIADNKIEAAALVKAIAVRGRILLRCCQPWSKKDIELDPRTNSHKFRNISQLLPIKHICGHQQRQQKPQW